MTSGQGSLGTAIEAMKPGACDYRTKAPRIVGRKGFPIHEAPSPKSGPPYAGGGSKSTPETTW